MRGDARAAAAMRAVKLSMLLLLAQLVLAAAAWGNDGTALENSRSGDFGWSPNPAPDEQRWGQWGAGDDIEAYAWAPSVVAGGPLQFSVRTVPVMPYRVEVHRLGWYGGTGGRRVLCLPTCSGEFPGVSQPDPPAPNPATGLLDAGWSITRTVTTDASWASGYYVAEFTLTAGPNVGKSTQVPFIVRSPHPDPNAILVMAPTNTWQAYNYWGGKSLYSRGSTSAGVKVSHRRPYVRNIPALYRYEIQLIRYLEREGRSLEYTTNLDVDAQPDSVRAHPAAISVGHDEYWSMRVRDAFEQARDAGTNLVFMGSNSAYWHVRHEDDRRTLVGYKDHADTEAPSSGLATVRFRTLGRPECSLLGVMYQGGYTEDHSVNREYTVGPEGLAHPWMAGTGFEPGDRLPYTVGYEWDAKVTGCTPATAVTFFERRATAEPEADLARGNGLLAHAVAYRAPSGATVFASGSMAFNFALDDLFGVSQPASPKAQQFVRAMLNDLGDRLRSPWPGDPAPVVPEPVVPEPVAPEPVAPGPSNPTGGGDPPPAEPPAGVPAVDARAPLVTLQAPRRARLRTLPSATLVARCDEACTGFARARFTGWPRPARAARVKTVARGTASAQRRAWRVSFSKATGRRVSAALAAGRPMRLRVRVSVKDAAGNPAAVTRSIRLHR